MFQNRKAVFVDRDDTLCPDVPYCNNPKLIQVYPDVPQSIKKLNKAGYLVIIITNQSGIGRGYFDFYTLYQVNMELMLQIKQGGGRIDDIFFCPHTPEDKCNCRKPSNQMGIHAIEKYNLDPKCCWMIGDHEKDMLFAKSLGIRCIQVTKNYSFSDAVEKILAIDKMGDNDEYSIR